ncbi:MAG: phosphoglucosamine mutase [Thermoleophilum sp.]|nr:phosphoglucosamine mutase [Thermoleophilum sp.]
MAVPPTTPTTAAGGERRLFGTDGVRGVAGETLTPELAVALGRALVCAHGGRPRVLVARDTRLSGPMLASALAAGIAAAGGEALLAGVLPTPAAAVVTPRLGLEFAAVISASHNPWQDNGIKFLGSDGTKIPDELELAIEAQIERGRASAPGAPAVAACADGGEVAGTTAPDPRAIGSVDTVDGASGDYLRALETRFGALDLSGLKVALDCANGATWQTAPEIFRRLGAEVVTVGCAPDGTNINESCGSTHPDAIARAVVEQGCDIGFAFDGDGDRVVAVDRNGRVRDGDDIVAAIARSLHAAGELAGGVAVTVMTNYGFHRAMRELGIEVAVTPVGDRHVLSALLERGWILGGEQSGHIIDRRFAATGDGTASALALLEALAGRDLATVETFERMPQTLVNVPVRDRGALEGNAAVRAAVERWQSELADEGRVLVRASGTEPLVRVMVEASDRSRCEAVAAALAEVVAAELG